MKKNTKTIILSLITTGLVVGVVVSKLGKKQKKDKISSLYVGDTRDYKEFFERLQYEDGGLKLL